MPMPDGTETPEEKAAREAGGAPPPPKPMQQRAPAPTNFVNFSRRFNANADVAKREAGKYGQQASDAAGAASDALKSAQQTFAQGVNTGMVQAPGGAPSTNTGPGATPPAPIPASNSGALTGESTRNPESTGPSLADMLAKAGQQYTGPTGLDDKAAAVAAEKAQQKLGALGSAAGVQALVNDSGLSGSTGADKLSGALIGSAGRQNFDALRAKFNPNKDIMDAQALAVDQAAKAKSDSDANAKTWGYLATAKGASDADMAAINSNNDAQAKIWNDTESAWNDANAGHAEYDAMGGPADKSEWENSSPEMQQWTVDHLLHKGSTASAYGFTGKAWTGGDLDANEIRRIITEMTPDEYARVMAGSNANAHQYRTNWFMARHAKDALGIQSGLGTSRS